MADMEMMVRLYRLGAVSRAEVAPSPGAGSMGSHMVMAAPPFLPWAAVARPPWASAVPGRVVCSALPGHEQPEVAVRITCRDSCGMQ
jgi:hypothetical protein